jgi:hypothetical protein
MEAHRPSPPDERCPTDIPDEFSCLSNSRLGHVTWLSNSRVRRIRMVVECRRFSMSAGCRSHSTLGVDPLDQSLSILLELLKSPDRPGYPPAPLRRVPPVFPGYMAALRLPTAEPPGRRRVGPSYPRQFFRGVPTVDHVMGFDNPPDLPAGEDRLRRRPLARRCRRRRSCRRRCGCRGCRWCCRRRRARRCRRRRSGGRGGRGGRCGQGDAAGTEGEADTDKAARREHSDPLHCRPFRVGPGHRGARRRFVHTHPGP